MENQRNIRVPEEVKKIASLEEKKEDLLFHAMKALDEMRGKTLIYSKYRDTQRLADTISDLLREIKKHKLHEQEGLQLANVSNNNRGVAEGVS